MKIVVINGQNHKGSTYNIGKMLVDKLDGDVKEFFLPRDFSSFCVGCTSCFMKDEKLCPHYEEMMPLVDALDDADVIILTSPVYVYHVTGSMKAFLDHLGYRWMVHRPEPAMFGKQAVCIATAAGAGVKWTLKDMAHSLFFWGVARTYKIGFAVHSTSFDRIDEKTMGKIERETSRVARSIKENLGKAKPRVKSKAFFSVMKKLVKGNWNPVDKEYWQKQGWLGGKNLGKIEAQCGK